MGVDYTLYTVVWACVNPKWLKKMPPNVAEMVRKNFSIYGKLGKDFKVLLVDQDRDRGHYFPCNLFLQCDAEDDYDTYAKCVKQATKTYLDTLTGLVEVEKNSPIVLDWLQTHGIEPQWVTRIVRETFAEEL